MDSVINYFLGHTVSLDLSPTLVVTWGLLYYLYRMLENLETAINNINVTLAINSAEIKSLSREQAQMHEDNVTLFGRKR